MKNMLWALTVPIIIIALLIFGSFEEPTGEELCERRTNGYTVVEARCANLSDAEWAGCKERIYWTAERFTWGKVIKDYCKAEAQ